MHLNDSLLHRYGWPDPRQKDIRFLALLDAAAHRIRMAAGLGAHGEHHAERLFRDYLANRTSAD